MTNQHEGNPAPAGFSGFSGHVWAVAGTPVTDPYPCRCREKKFDECSPAWCACAGRVDILPPPCCSSRFSPEDHVNAMREWRIRQQEKKART